MVENKDKGVRLTSRDKEHGGLLARGIPGGSNRMDCPTTEELSEFIDGKLSRKDRGKMVAHLSECGLCSSILSESLTIREELISRSRAKTKRYLSYSIPAALAAAAVVLFVFRTSQPDHEFAVKPQPEQKSDYRAEAPEKKPAPKPDVVPLHRSFAGELADRLSRNSQAAVLVRIAANQAKPKTAYGFSSAVPIEKAAFRIGARLADIEVALKAQDGENVEAYANKLIELLKPLEATYGIAPTIRQKGNGKETGRYEGFSSAVEALFDKKQEAVFLKLGAWVEAAGLAADVRDASFFQPDVVGGFRRDLETSGVPVGTVKNLSLLESIITSGKLNTEEFTTMAQLLADIKEMF